MSGKKVAVQVATPEFAYARSCHRWPKRHNVPFEDSIYEDGFIGRVRGQVPQIQVNLEAPTTLTVYVHHVLPVTSTDIHNCFGMIFMVSTPTKLTNYTLSMGPCFVYKKWCWIQVNVGIFMEHNVE